MIEIASHDEGILQKEISVNQSISTKYLDQIIASLIASGLVVRVSGKRSGYKLSRLPTEISVYDIYKAFEFELNIVECGEKTPGCPLIGHCKTQSYWCDLNKVMADHMRSQTLDDIMKV